VLTVVNTLKARLKNFDFYLVRGVAPHYRKGMVMFWWYGFLIAISAAFIDNYVTLYALALGATSLQVGYLSSASSFMGMIAPIPGAQWAARWGKRKSVVVISFALRRLMELLTLIVPFLVPAQTAIVLIIVLFALRAGFGNLGTPPWSSLAADLVPIEWRGRYFSGRKSLMAAASLLCVPLAGQIIEWWGLPRGYQVAFMTSIAFGIVAVTFYAFIPEPPLSAAARREQSFSVFWRSLTENRTFLLYTLFSMVFNFAWQISGPYFGVYQVTELGATPQIVGFISTAGALTRVFGQQYFGRAVDKRGARWALVMSLLFIPILPFMWFPMTNAWHVLFVTIPSGFLWAGYEIANFNLQLELPVPERRTQAIAAYTTLIGLANILGPLAGGALIETLGYKWNFAISGVGRLVGGLLLWALLKPFARRAASSPN